MTQHIHCKKRGVTEHPRGAIFYCFHGNSMGYHGNSKILLPWGVQLHHVFYSVIVHVHDSEFHNYILGSDQLTMTSEAKVNIRGLAISKNGFILKSKLFVLRNSPVPFILLVGQVTPVNSTVEPTDLRQIFIVVSHRTGQVSSLGLIVDSSQQPGSGLLSS